jgi:hypothetical protein
VLSLEEVQVHSLGLVVVVDRRREGVVRVLLFLRALEVLRFDLGVLVELLVSRRVVQLEVADLLVVDPSTPASERQVHGVDLGRKW